MRIYLDVSYSEKDQAKQLGARWDPKKKQWYVQDPFEIFPFLRWMPKRKPVRELYEKLNAAKLKERSVTSISNSA